MIRIKIPETREDWLERRKAGIGGSDAGAVLGLNQYKSPYTLWAEKSGLISGDIPDNEAMRQGRDLEQYVADRWMEATGKKCRKTSFSYQSDEHPWMLANVDRLVTGEKAGLECKTASALTRTKYDKGDIPASYYAQCMHYLAVTGLERWYIAIVVLGKGFYTYEIERDDAEIESLIAAEKDFWEHVTSGDPPEIDGSDSTADTLAMMYPDSDPDETIYLSDLEDTVDLLEKVNEKEKELKSLKKEYENKIKEALSKVEKADTGNASISWKTVTSSRLDTKRLKEDQPSTYESYCKVSKSRRLTIKMRKKEEE